MQRYQKFMLCLLSSARSRSIERLHCIHACCAARDAVWPEVSVPTKISQMSISIAGIARYRLYAIYRIDKFLLTFSVRYKREVLLSSCACRISLIRDKSLWLPMVFILFLFRSSSSTPMGDVESHRLHPREKERSCMARRMGSAWSWLVRPVPLSRLCFCSLSLSSGRLLRSSW